MKRRSNDQQCYSKLNLPPTTTSIHNTKRTKNLLLGIFFLGVLSIHHLRNVSSLVTIKDEQYKASATYIDKEGVCVNALPYAKMHHMNAKEIEMYQLTLVHKIGGYAPSYGEIDPPELQTLPPGSIFAAWDCTDRPDCDLPFNGRNIIKGSAWSVDGKIAAHNGDENDKEFRSNFDDPKKVWLPHEEYVYLAKKITFLQGDTVAMIGFFPNNYGHIIHDNFPLLAWLKSTVPEHTTFALPDAEPFRNLIRFIEPQFLKRIYFYQSNEMIIVEDGTLTVTYSKGGRFLADYGNTLMRHMRHWIFDNHPETYPDDEKYVIYYSRGGNHTEHGRTIENEHEQDILAIIHAKMEKYNRKEKLIIFTGEDEKGNVLPYIEQFRLFRHASTVIGPHGSGLANIVWTNPFPKTCNDRVQVLEFIGGTDALEVQKPVFNGYYWVLRGMPIDWHQVTYASNSTEQVLYLQLNDLHRALDYMLG